ARQVRACAWQPPRASSRHPTEPSPSPPGPPAGSAPRCNYPPRHTGKRFKRICRSLTDDEIDELARYDGGLPDHLNVPRRLHLRGALGALDQLLLLEVGGNFHPVSDLPVDLDDELEGLAGEQGRVGLGPRLLPESPPAHALP